MIQKFCRKISMEHLLRIWPKAAVRIRQCQHIVILLDYDGTLTPIAPTPAQARLSGATRAVLRHLSRSPNVHIGIISGRALREVKRLVGLSGVIYVGNHGLEVGGSALSFVHPQARRFRPVLRRLARQLDRALRKVSGALVEWKGLTISIHWRRVPRSDHRMFRQLVDTLTAQYLNRRMIRLTLGKRVVEIRPPVEWNKGKIIEWLVGRIAGQFPSQRTWTAYVGDDQTDEDAFRVVNRLRGLSVFVGHPRRQTAAQCWLNNPREVHCWLTALNRVCGAHGRRESRWNGHR